MIDTLTKGNAYEKRSLRDNLTLLAWIFTWMLSLTVSDKAALYGWWSAEWATVLSIVANVGIGAWVIRSYMNMLRGMDDLQRKIQLESLAMALGISMVGTVAYSLLVTWGYILDEEVSDIFVLMCVSYSLSIVIGMVKYR